MMNRIINKKCILMVFLVALSLLVGGCGATTDSLSPSEKTSTEDKLAKDPIIETGGLEIHHLNVDQADSTLIITPNGKSMLIDAGERSSGEKVVQYLKQIGISSIDKLVITHAHEDHLGGAVAVMNNFAVGEVLDSGIPHTSETYIDYLSYIDEHDIDFVVPRAGDMINLDSELDIVVVNSGQEGDDLNNASISLHITYNDFTYLTTGDAEEAAEKRMVNHFNIKSDVLKVGHHGSATSSESFFLEEVNPSVAIISYGEGNSYGHPHVEVLERLTTVGTNRVYHTIRGPIVVKSDGLQFEVTGEAYTAEPSASIDEKPNTTNENLININTADYETLQIITGVGDVIAQRIIDYRNVHGAFKSIEEIKKVSGIGDATYQKMSDEITI
ncbi:helix-hairpin-helix domain-containing protein [Bacillus solitudinis]|uniref:helix-hairpin-helix domain-containing protein n=1 Tax=Bacillus solitudinis TaxID=2014074 RepID=UPI000C238616|nr:helix-hairpin-helix domain-containing protein [Bacillus solitudinis]